MVSRASLVLPAQGCPGSHSFAQVKLVVSWGGNVAFPTAGPRKGPGCAVGSAGVSEQALPGETLGITHLILLRVPGLSLDRIPTSLVPVHMFIFNFSDNNHHSLSPDQTPGLSPGLLPAQRDSPSSTSSHPGDPKPLWPGMGPPPCSRSKAHGTVLPWKKTGFNPAGVEKLLPCYTQGV